jgi:polyisoprenoid-binding protein YceI
MSPSITATRYSLNAARSRFTVQAFATGLLASFGHSPIFLIRDFAGQLHFSSDRPGECAFNMTVQTASLEVTGNLKETDRADIQRVTMEEVLEIKKFPEIAYRSTQMSPTKITEGWYRLQIGGLLRLHGMIRHVPIDSQLRIAEQTMQLNGEFTIKLTEYNIKPVSGAAGLLKVKDELKFQFNLLGDEIK